MTRDPSDGSVKPMTGEIPAKPKREVPSAMPPIDPVDHVLRAREQRSKQWLAEYRAKQAAARKPQEEG